MSDLSRTLGTSPTLGAVRLRRGDASVEPAVRKLSSLCSLTIEDLNLVRGLDRGRETFGTGAEICGEGHRRPRVIVSGWAARVRVLPDGRRQILTLLLPGDTLD